MRQIFLEKVGIQDLDRTEAKHRAKSWRVFIAQKVGAFIYIYGVLMVSSHRSVQTNGGAKHRAVSRQQECAILSIDIV